MRRRPGRRRGAAPPGDSSAPTPRDVLGVPTLPPGAATVAVNRMRARLGRLHAGMAPPPVRILEGVFGLLDHQVLVGLCAAGVPDALDRPIRVEELAGRIDADPVLLHRLCRFAAGRGWVRFDRRGRVRPTRVTAFLRSDHPGGWRAWVEFAGGAEVRSAVHGLVPSASPQDPFRVANGAPFFEWLARHPDRWLVFDRAMAAGARMHALGLATAVDWATSTAVCDVGGGDGTLLAALLDLKPWLRGSVLELPAVVDRCVRHDRLDAVAGDAFVHVPSGSDTYLLVNVLHDWGDADATRILGRVAEALPPDGRVVVVDSDPAMAPFDRIAASVDVLMAALTDGGRERTTHELARIGESVGLRLERTWRLASGDVAHCLRLSQAGVFRA